MKPVIHVGLVYENATQTISIASFSDQGDQKCYDDCQRQFPDLPHFVFQLFEEPAIFKQRLYTWLTEQNIPAANHEEFMLTVIKAIREMFKEETNASN